MSVMVNLNREDTNVVLGGKGFVLWGGNGSRTSCAACGSVYHRSRFIRSTAGRRRSFTASRAISCRPGRRTRCSTSTADRDDRAFHGKKERDRSSAWETVAQAVEDAKRNAEENGIENARFLCADAGRGRRAAFKRRGSGPPP